MARRKRIISDIQVIDIADKGHAVGKTAEGEIVILLGGCVPGDVVQMRVHRNKKGLKHGYVTEILSHSKDRVEPFCEHFGTCGGCKWQQLDYNVQAHLKEKAVRNAIQRIAKEDPSKVEPILSASIIREYRNKLEYTFSTKRWLTVEEIESEEDFSSRRGLGFHIAGAFDKVLEVTKCHLQEDLSNRIRNQLRYLADQHQWSYYDIRNHTGLLRNIIIRNSTLGEWMVTVVFGEEDQHSIKEVMDQLVQGFPDVDAWYYIINLKKNSSLADVSAIHHGGATHINEVLGDIKYRISPKSFFQTNSHQAKLLYDTALAYAKLRPEDVVYDLYTGTGSIALYLAKHCASVIGIEVISEAIDDARINAEMNQITNATFLVGDVKDVLAPGFAHTYGNPDVVITDPPRAGMHADVVTTLLELRPDRIVYISCNPATQARDINLLSESYGLVKVKPCDMFPHTSHIESVAVLKRKED